MSNSSTKSRVLGIAPRMLDEPLADNPFAEGDPRREILAPFFKIRDELMVLAAEYPDLSVNWCGESGCWVQDPPPARLYPQLPNIVTSPGSDLLLQISAEKAASRLLGVVNAGINVVRDPWLDFQRLQVWERWLHAIRDYWLTAKDEAQAEGFEEDTFSDAASNVGYRLTHNLTAIGGRVWRTMIKTKQCCQKVRLDLGLSAGPEVDDYEEPVAWLDRGCIDHVFAAGAHFCGVLAARRAGQISEKAEGDITPLVAVKLDEKRPGRPIQAGRWQDLISQLDVLRAQGPPLSATWMAYDGCEEYGIWLLSPDGPETDEIRAAFGLIAAQAIATLGLPPLPVPKPEQHYPDWERYCAMEEELYRKSGGLRDMSNLKPYGLAEIDRDAVDPCTRAWLELLRAESQSFRYGFDGAMYLAGTKYTSRSGEIRDLFGATLAMCRRVERDRILSTLIGPTQSRRPTDSGRQEDESATTADPHSTVVHRSTEGEGTNTEPSGIAGVPKRIPDIDLSLRRLELFNVLARELAILKGDLKGHCTVTRLKTKYRTFQLWNYMEDAQLNELIDGAEFTPKAYAENLTLTAFGVTSKETLKKDRQKVRRAQKQPPRDV